MGCDMIAVLELADGDSICMELDRAYPENSSCGRIIYGSDNHVICRWLVNHLGLDQKVMDVGDWHYNPDYRARVYGIRETDDDEEEVWVPHKQRPRRRALVCSVQVFKTIINHTWPRDCSLWYIPEGIGSRPENAREAGYALKEYCEQELIKNTETYQDFMRFAEWLIMASTFASTFQLCF